MSASSQLVLEQIKEVKSKLQSAQELGQPTNELEKQLSELNQKLDAMQQAQLLKG